MKHLFCILSLLATALVATAQPHIEWQKCLGGPGDEWVSSIRQTSDGGFIVAGQSRTSGGDVTGNHGEYDYWIIKLSATGNKVWAKSFGGSADDVASCAIETKDGGYIVSGYTLSSDGDVTGYTGGFNDLWIVKLSSTGTIQWQKDVACSDNQVGNIEQTTDGGYVVITSSTCSTNGSNDYRVVKLSSTGSIQWQKYYGGINTESANSVHQTTDGGYILAGSSMSKDFIVPDNNGKFDFFIVKLNDTGAVQWQRSFGSSRDDIAGGVRQTFDGGYVVTGIVSNNDSDVAGYHGGIEDGWILKLSENGIMEWQQCIGGSKDDAATDIVQATDGGYAMVCSSQSADGNFDVNHGDYDSWLVKTSYKGVVEWTKSFGGSKADNPVAVRLTADGGYIVAGSTNSTDGDVSGNNGGYDIWIVKLIDKTGISTVNPSNNISVSPNPTTGNIAITGFNNPNIKVYNTIGQLLKEDIHTNTMSVAELPSGLYFIRLFDDQGQMIAQDKIIKQ